MVSRKQLYGMCSEWGSILRSRTRLQSMACWLHLMTWWIWHFVLRLVSIYAVNESWLTSWPIPLCAASETTTVNPELHPEVEPMQVGRTRLAVEEKQRCLNQQLCFYCGKSGYFAAACPLKSRVRQQIGEYW